jgi:tripartite-type tricarboxylate transporter receptor subunit TctC
LTDFDAATWSGFFLPKNTPTAIVQKLNSGLTVVDTAAVRRLRSRATVVAPERRSPAYLQTFIERDQEWAGQSGAANLSVN